MKLSNSNSSGLVCHIVRVWSSFISGFPADGGDDFISRHVTTCESCRVYFRAGESFESQLRRDARSQMQQVPDGLEDRIFGSIEVPVRQTRRANRGARMFAYSLAGAAAVSAAAFILLREPMGPSGIAQNQTIRGEDSPEIIASTSIAAIDAVPRGMRNLVDSSVATLDEQNPLQRETEAVYSDSRSVLRFLARNFLPRVPDALSTDPATPTT